MLEQLELGIAEGSCGAAVTEIRARREPEKQTDGVAQDLQRRLEAERILLTY